MEDILSLLLLFAVGTIAGFMNVNAGGGSTLTLPALIFLGLDASVAPEQTALQYSFTMSLPFIHLKKKISRNSRSAACFRFLLCRVQLPGQLSQ